jgi:hypothetical protein
MGEEMTGEATVREPATEPEPLAVHPVIEPTTSSLTWANQWDHWLARWGVNRGGHRVAPGLYALGRPNVESAVFVTANYSLSFDALRSALPGVDAHILVLDTKGINVWCAAGKGTFGTDELVHRIDVTGLRDVVSRRVIVLPQLGAPGVAAHDVKRRTGFRVQYGPVRARDLPEYLRTGQATPEMRRVRFDWVDRLVLIPVEIVHTFLKMAIAAVILFLIGGLVPALAAVAAVWAGCVLFPLLLPWLPTREFSSKGFVLGTIVALPFAAWLALQPGLLWWQRLIWLAISLLGMPAVTAYLSLNFTGSSTFTSRTGVRAEMVTHIPYMAAMAAIAGLSIVALAVVRVVGVMGG